MKGGLNQLGSKLRIRERIDRSFTVVSYSTNWIYLMILYGWLLLNLGNVYELRGLKTKFTSEGRHNPIKKGLYTYQIET